MYTQFFGNFLLQRNIVTPDQLIAAINQEATSHIKLGTLARSIICCPNKVPNTYYWDRY